MSRRLSLLVLLYALSGAVGLAWQVVWVRAFTPVFGAGLEAISAVTAMFLAGLGLGGWLAPRLLARWPPLVAYARLEAVVGLWGAALPWALVGLDGPLTVALRALGEGPAVTGFRLLVAALLVGPPAVALGATFPAVTEALGAEQDHSRVGLAYGVNALGAAGGALLAGLWLPWALGLRLGSVLLGAGNLLVAGGALALARGGSTAQGEAAHDGQSPPGLWGLAFATGFVGLGLEVAWSRLSGPLLAARFGTDAVAFAAVLAAVVGGIGIGGVVARRWGQNLGLALAAVQGGLALLTLAVLEPARELMLGERHIELLEGLLPLLPALLLGASFPLLSNALLARVGARRGVARLYAVNTAGSVLGSLVAGFWLVPLLGAQRYAVVLATLSAVIAAVLLWGSGRRVMLAGWVVVAGAAIAVVGTTAAPVAGARVLPPFEVTLDALEGRETSTLVSARPGGDERALTSAGHRIGAAATGAGIDDHALRALAPASLHEAPKRVLMIGLGTGATARAFLGVDSVEQLTVVELDANQRHMLHWFGTEDILADPRLTLVDGDGRHFVRMDQTAWDVIAVDAYGPRTSSATFYTADFYAEAKARLAPGGLLWVKFNPASLTDADTLAGYLASLFSEFPDGALLFMRRGLFGLVGPADDTVRLPPEQVVADPRTSAALVAGHRMHTDDHPVLVEDRVTPGFEALEPYWKARSPKTPPPWVRGGPRR